MSEVNSVLNPSPYESMLAYVQVYNSNTLILLLRSGNFQFGGKPPENVLADCMETYTDPSFNKIESAFGLTEIIPPQQFYNLYTGNVVTVNEHWVLISIQPYSYVPAFVDDPKGNPFKLGYIQLTYVQADNIPDLPLLLPEFGGGFGGEGSGSGASGEWEELPSPPYPVRLCYGYPYPVLGEFSWYGVFIAIWNGVPTMHARYGIQPEWLFLATNYPGLEEPYTSAFEHGIFDCFREAIESDGAPWYTPEKRLFISKGINDSWVDTYTELRDNRGFPFNGGMRIWHWLNLAGVANRYWYTPGGLEEHVDIKCSALPANVNGRAYRLWQFGGGIVPIIATITSTILPALIGTGFFGIRLHAEED